MFLNERDVMIFLIIEVSCVGEDVDLDEYEFGSEEEMKEFMIEEERGELVKVGDDWKMVNDEGFVLIRKK